MRRRAKPAKAKVGAELPVARKSRKNEGSRVHDLEKRLADALEQQTATGEILRVIASSPPDVQPVLDAVAESAARLCNAYDAVIFRLDNGILRRVAHHGPIPAPPGFYITATRGRVFGRAVLDRQPIQVADAQVESEEFPETRTFARAHGFRTILSVPLLREGIALGTVDLRRTEMHPFTERQIALLKTFADQAVIAIENVRLFKELEARNRDLTEALERHTAMSEILRVIASSPTDLDPVLEAVARNAAQLCRAEDVAITRAEEDGLTILYSLGPDVTVRGRKLPHHRTATSRAIREVRTVHVPDLLADPDIELRPEFQRFGWRTGLAVPLVPRGRRARHHHCAPGRSASVQRSADQAARDLRRPSSHRDRERTALQGTAGEE
jgi:two-component system, NtrC family, sensor kinase